MSAAFFGKEENLEEAKDVVNIANATKRNNTFFIISFSLMSTQSKFFLFFNKNLKTLSIDNSFFE